MTMMLTQVTLMMLALQLLQGLARAKSTCQAPRLQAGQRLAKQRFPPRPSWPSDKGSKQRCRDKAMVTKGPGSPKP